MSENILQGNMSNLVDRIRELGYCEPSCEGRCRRCPQDDANEVANEVQKLIDELKTWGQVFYVASGLAQ